MHKKQLTFLDPRAAIETCVTNKTKLFRVHILAFVLVMINFYFQNCVDNIAILSSATMIMRTMTMQTYRLH